MKRVMVRYTVKPGRAAENERCEVAPVRTVLHEVGSYAAGYAGMRG